MTKYKRQHSGPNFSNGMMWIFFIAIVAYITYKIVSCNRKVEAAFRSEMEAIDAEKAWKASLSKAIENTLSFSGRFVRIEPINSKEYYLFLKGDDDSIFQFRTLMPVSDDEIRLLKKKGNNINLNYINFYDSANGINERIVKAMIPIYEIEE
jgi:hypothetical protein